MNIVDFLLVAGSILSLSLILSLFIVFGLSEIIKDDGGNDESKR